jgi:hypothetical protein
MTPNVTTPEPVAPERRDDAGEQPIALFADQQIAEMRRRWDEIQAAFVDEPRAAVEKADKLVSEAATDLTNAFGRLRAELDGQWKRGDSVSTEDLRQALRRYRSFFTRLLEA